MIMDVIKILRGHLLIAVPSIENDGFEHTVVYVCEHQAQGGVGLIINKPLIYPLGFMFDLLNIESEFSVQKSRPLLYGGPVQPERGFVLHRPPGSWSSSLLLEDDVTLTTSNDIIHAFARNEGPKDALIALGFVGWEGAKLEKEIMHDRWLVCSYKPEVLYDVPFEKRWEYTASLIGVNWTQLVEGGGHA
jgi:putative transcriptional regulator